MKQVASLRYDVIFKKAFSVPGVFSNFVSAILGKPVTFDRVETEKRFDEPIGHIDPRFDLYAENPEQNIIVDIQNTRYSDHYHRFLYDHCAALFNSVPHSSNYRPNVEIFTIVVLTSGDRHGKDIATIHFDPVDHQGNPLGEIAHKVIFLCSKYVSDNTPEPIQSWLRAIEDTLDEEVDVHNYDVAIQQVFELIEKNQITPAERARLKDEFSHQELILEERRQREEERRQREEERRQREEAERVAVEERRQREEERRMREEAERVAMEAQAELAALRAQVQALKGNTTNDPS